MTSNGLPPSQGTLGSNSDNIVHLSDPKHIRDFGSDVVHVNVSCGRATPGKRPMNQVRNSTLENSSQSCIAPTDATSQDGKTEDEDTQTFIIQLSEEQTRQLANGTLTLNGVPIPKDLSNLSYTQIMALLDSVNTTSTQKGTTQTGNNKTNNVNGRSSGCSNRYENEALGHRPSIKNPAQQPFSHSAQQTKTTGQFFYHTNTAAQFSS